ncbi:MAG: AraC family transcriptional regulator [Lachnospiraceae bacterium]|nr:AraC family transcriptional regulator [Lachnospiraceae bacterium]MDY4971811.1 AraC family transcriptional regulator [Lachnospiraceae bacterium]
MAYRGITLVDEIHIEQLFTVHYFEYMSNFHFPGESHDFWEFLCVDKGEVEVWGDDNRYTLKKDDIIFHKPNEFHGLKANGTVAPNLMVLSFSCPSAAMEYFRERVLHINEEERTLLGRILQEAGQCFSGPMNDPYQNQLERKASADIPFGCEQLLRLYLEEFLVLLQRRYLQVQYQDPEILSRTKLNKTESGKKTGKLTKKKADKMLYDHIVSYMKSHIHSSLSIEQICRDNMVSRSQLQKLFREQNHCGIIRYFSILKIEAAKQYIRSDQLNFTQIADVLGYSTIHYFSRQFKQVTGMTPSEYASSIKGLSEQKL